MWDYYQDKLLRAMLIDLNFNFVKVSEFFKRTTNNADYTPLACQERWAELHKLRKQNDQQSQLISPLEALLSRLPETRTPKNYLEVKPEDLVDAYTENFEGKLVKVSGCIIRF